MKIESAARWGISFVALLAMVLVAAFVFYGRSVWMPVVIKLKGARMVADVVATTGVKARERMSAAFDVAGVGYPPDEIHLLAVKDHATLELWVGDKQGPQYM